VRRRVILPIKVQPQKMARALSPNGVAIFFTETRRLRRLIFRRNGNDYLLNSLPSRLTSPTRRPFRSLWRRGPNRCVKEWSRQQQRGSKRKRAETGLTGRQILGPAISIQIKPGTT